MPIVDSQIHLWQNGSMPAAHRRVATFSADDALKEMAEAGVDAAVIHPPSGFGEASNAQGVEAARLHPDKFCILGHINLASPDLLAMVKNWRQRPGMIGIRIALNRPEQQHWWSDGSLEGFWTACEKQGLPIGTMASEPIANIARVAERHPLLKLHVDHLGRPHSGAAGIDDAAFANLGDLLDLARYPNVAVKLSGAPGYSSHPYPHRNIHPYIRQVYDAFGPQRCFWGTDLTRMPCSYRQCVTMFTEEMPWLRGRDLELVMGEAFCGWLGWER